MVATQVMEDRLTASQRALADVIVALTAQRSAQVSGNITHQCASQTRRVLASLSGVCVTSAVVTGRRSANEDRVSTFGVAFLQMMAHQLKTIIVRSSGYDAARQNM